ncbi:MAG: replicative DNA helicase [Planctomycetaceae bacterium]|nr:replicative DNA helicase [Planctomycetaceae bacterium]
MADPNIEACFLASCILSTVALEDFHTRFEPKDFADGRHQVLWRTLVALYNTGCRDIDGAQVWSELQKTSNADAAGGAPYLREIVESVPSAANARYYAKILNDRIIRRSLYEAADAAMRQVDDGEDLPGILDAFESRLMVIRSSKRFPGDAESNEADAKDLLAQAFSTVCDAVDGKKPPCRPLGVFELDEILDGGLRPGDLMVLAARPSVGKTAFALNVAATAARDTCVVFVSLEMDPTSLAIRLISSESGVSASALRRGMIRQDEFAKLPPAVQRLQERDMMVVSVPSMSPLEVRSQVRRLARKKPVGLIVVDYLQLMQVDHKKTENRNQEVGILSRMMKGLALEVRCPMILLSQLNRSPEGRTDHRPRMADLRESGNIEQDADVVLFLHREDYYHQNDPAWSTTNQAELILAKQRNGAIGLVTCGFEPTTMTFHSLRP